MGTVKNHFDFYIPYFSVQKAKGKAQN